MAKEVFFDGVGNQKKCVLCNNSELAGDRSGNLKCKVSSKVNPCPTKNCRFDNMFRGEDFKSIQAGVRQEVAL